MVLGPGPDLSDEINALGSALQSATGIGGISVALYGTLYGLDMSVKALELPVIVLQLIGVSVFLSLLASVTSLMELMNKLGMPRKNLVSLEPFAFLFWGIVAFGVAYLFFAVPAVRSLAKTSLGMLGEFFERLSELL